MKIAFCSAVSFGAQGSPGTYKFIEVCYDYYEIMVFAPLGYYNTVFYNPDIPIVPLDNLHSKENVEKLIDGLHSFAPDIIYIFNFPSWHKLVLQFKKQFPNVKLILDIKSPLLAEKKKRKEIQIQGNLVWANLDAIVTLSAPNIPTWIPDCKKEPIVYPLGIDFALFNGGPALGRTNCFKFVYIGVLHAKRQLGLLINAFRDALIKTEGQISLDIYGSGPDREYLEKLALSRSFGKRIRFLGLYPQKELARILPTYDASIAWVPNETYDTSPSLKAIESMAAGLPIIASDTKAHRMLEKEGCSIEFFSNTVESLSEVLLKVNRNGFDRDRMEQNFQIVKKYSYDRILQSYFHPVFQNLVKINDTEDDQMEKGGCILYIGPLGFRPGVWETRANYILPDLFEAVPDQFETHMLTGRVPEFAKDSLKQFCEKYSIAHHEARPKPKNATPYEYWKSEILFVGRQIHPDVITNVFAPVTLGTAMGRAGQKIGARVVLRVAGDEIGSRIPMGIYDGNIEKLDWDMASQTLAFQMADTIVVMSPLEKSRVCVDLPKSEWKKVIICIRGVDVSRFFKSNKEYLSDRVDRFLYVGRKSLEKGFDVLEAVADTVLLENEHIQFAFAGSFDPLKIKNRDYIGWVENNELHRIFSESDAFIMTSRTEGFPQVLAEAMATGLPCILPKHLFQNIFTNGAQALLTSLDPTEISKAVLQLHKDKQLANSLSKQARQFAETQLDKKIWSKVYHDILLGAHNEFVSPFSKFASMTEEDPELGVTENRLKILFIISPHLLGSRPIRNKLNRLFIEMIKRKHLVYFVLPENNEYEFNTSDKATPLIYVSREFLKKQIQQISPDLLVISATEKERSKYYSLAHGINISRVILELYCSQCQEHAGLHINEYESAQAIWENEILYSSASLILKVEESKIKYLSNFISRKVKPYPQTIIQTNKNGGMDTGGNVNLLREYPLYNLNLESWADSNSKMYDCIEALFITVSKERDKPEKLLAGQLKFDREIALHLERMKERLNKRR